jgi:hypothetical protein
MGAGASAAGVANSYARGVTMDQVFKEDDLREYSLQTAKFTQMWIKLLLGGVKHVPANDKKTSLEVQNFTPKTLLQTYPVPVGDSGYVVRFTDDDEDFGDLFGFHNREGFVGKITGELFEDSEKLPFEQEKQEYFPSLEVAEQSMKDVYGTLFDSLPVKWSEFESDDAFTMLAFNGIGMYYLTGVPDEHKHKTQVPTAACQIDLHFMHQFACRKPYERYGCIAYFDINKAPLAVYWSFKDKLVFPSDPEWSHVKFVFRCTMCVAITAKDHLINLHWQISNTMLFASRQSFSPEHSLRRLIKPHTYRAAKVNWASKYTLLPLNNRAHRTFALEAKDYHDFVAVGISCLKFQTFPDEIAAKNLPPEIASMLPYKVDGEALWSVIRAYVADYIDIFYVSDAEVCDDLSVLQFYAHYQNPACWHYNVSVCPFKCVNGCGDVCADLVNMIMMFVCFCFRYPNCLKYLLWIC